MNIKNVLYPLMLIMMSCSLFNDEEAKVRFRFTNSSLVKQDMISLVLTDGKRSWKLEGEDFAPDAEGPHSFGETPALKTATAGTLKTSFELRAKNELVSAGEFEIPLRSDWQWSVDFLIGANIRYQNCFGCLGQKAFPLADNFRAVANDSVYVVWGGNSIKHPVIY